MIQADRRKKFIEEICALAQNKENMRQVQQRLYEFFLTEVPTKKLYKYRPYKNNEYTLKNLSTNTLYCPCPSEFNDPFDCKLGVSIELLIKAKYEKGFKALANLSNRIGRILEEKIDESECTSSEQKVFKLLQNIKKENGRKDNTEEFLSVNLDSIVEITRIIMSDENYFSLPIEAVSLLSEIMKNISPDGLQMFSKNGVTLPSFAQVYGIDHDVDKLDLIREIGEKIQPGYIEQSEALSTVIDDFNNKIKTEIDRLFAVGCLCSDYKNKLMWSHYADSHKGICIEFDFSDLKIEDNTILPFPVIYSDERPIVPWDVAINKNLENNTMAVFDFMKGLLTKDNIWAYENEWRVIINAKEDHNFLMPRVSCVYLGAAFDETDLGGILEIAKKNKFQVKKMVVDRGKYELHAKDITI